MATMTLRHRLNAPRAPRGFTLIELMVVVAIIAILASIAYPAYNETVARSRRADAKSVLLENAQWMERQYTVLGSYSVTSALPITESPKGSGGKVYTVSFAASSAASFTLQAVPKNSMANDKCGTLTLTSKGAKDVTSATATATECWDR
jgi:type IV pilus assembly protein PilE